MSLARRKRDRILAAQTINAAQPIHAGGAPVRGANPAPAAAASPAAGANTASPAARAEREIALRLTHDLRRLKEIKSIDRKIAAKREMIPEYVSWVKGVLEADAGVGTGVAAEVLPTVMVWLIDIADYFGALDLLPFMLRHKVAMPSRYQRDAATIVVEEIATAAAKAQNAGEAFPLAILYDVQQLTGSLDLHDEVRAKLMKAIGVEELRDAEDMEASPAARAHLTVARDTLREAHRLNDRVGVKDRIKRAEKLIEANLAAFPPEIEQNGDPAA
ncbi:phage terminase small subunit [Novosphingobium colocasiae]|uniref:phage terminase small subunit n=1 Tax=Novosphingobium colocasiae TaxID=1256513 RepID=UPI0035ADAB0A